MIHQQISEMVQAAIDGKNSAAEVYANLQMIQEVVKHGKDHIIGLVLEEVEQMNKDEVYYGGVWSSRNTPDTLDFEQDQQYKELNEQLKARRKALTEAYKASKSGKGFFDNESSEVIPLVDVKKPGGKVPIFKPK